MSRTALGGLLLTAGLVLLATFMFVVRLPDGLQITGTFLLGIVPAVIGAAMLWSGFRSTPKSKDPEAGRLAGIKEQIVWRAQAGLPPMEVELALMSLVAEGRAAVEPGESGEVVYRIASPLGGAGAA